LHKLNLYHYATQSGFLQILVRPENSWKCAFVTHHGEWTWKRRPFVLWNAPAIF